MPSVDVAALRKRYQAAGQEHLFSFWDELTPDQQTSFAQQLSELDVERVNRVYEQAIQAATAKSSSGAKIEPPPPSSTQSIVGQPKKEADLRKVGLEAIANGQVGVILMAGGQGTRLGSSAPKGCYDIGLPSHKTLFQLQAERIARLQTVAAQAAGKKEGEVVIPWYIMTSGPTRKATETFFREKKFFGLKEENVIFFEQGTLPCLSNEGKILLETKSSIAVAPDGNGGVYSALRGPTSAPGGLSVISSLSQRNILYLHAYCVDNCLVKVADPVFLGDCISTQADCGVKVVRKTRPSESVGVVALRDGKFGVVEYSELPSELAEKRDETSGELAFRAANIANHFYTTDFLSTRVPAFEKEMAFHIARKKIPTVSLDASNRGESIKPSKPNGMKLELFVFDVFPYTEHLAVLEVAREEEFSPLKNAPGTGSDDPETSRRDLLAQQKRWLEATGAEVAAEVELSPLVTYAGEGLEGAKGKRFDAPKVVESAAHLAA